MQNSAYDAIVFDFDGTLVDSKQVKTEAFAKLYEPYGEDIALQVVKWHQANEGISRFVKFKYWHEVLLNKPYTDAEGERLSGLFSERVLETIINAPYISGALAFLEAYYQSIPLFIASGTPEAELLEIVSKRNMTQYFQGIYGSPKTKQAILEQILAKAGYTPQRVLMVGDALSDWEGAQAVGTQFLGVQVDELGPLTGKAMFVENLAPLSQYIHGA